MFLGKYSHTIDSKGRLIIPAKFRDEIGSAKLVVAPWWEGDLTVFTQEGFREYIKSLDELQGSAEARRRIKRFITSGADECRLDAQGRILLNQHLRDYAHLSGGCDPYRKYGTALRSGILKYGEKTENLLNDAEGDAGTNSKV